MEIASDIKQLQRTFPGTLYDSGYIDGHIEDPLFEFVTFAGGGIGGVGYAGVLLALDEEGVRDHIKYWNGSSIGAICAILGAMRMKGKDIIQKIETLDVSTLIDNALNTEGGWFSKFTAYRTAVVELITRLGVIKGDKFKDWLCQEVKNLGFSPDITFAELYDLTGSYLSITLTSVNTKETLHVSRSNYPYMKIVDAGCGTIILPMLFQPIELQDPLVPKGKRLLIDGGVMDNYPQNAYDVTSEDGEILAFNRKAIGFTLISDGRMFPEFIKINGLFDYSLAFIDALHSRIHILQSQQPYYWDRTVPIDTHGLNFMDFYAEKDRLRAVMDSGYKAARKFIRERREEIHAKGPLPGNLFIPNFRLRCQGIDFISDDLLKNTNIYQTNPLKFATGSIPISKIST